MRTSERSDQPRRRRTALMAAVCVVAATLAGTVVGLPGRAAAAVSAYRFSPQPLAAPGALGPGSAVTVVLTAVDDQGNPAGGVPVWLSFSSSAADGGSATASGVALSATPHQLLTTANGEVAISYRTANPSCGGPVCIPGPYPSAGLDTITAADAGTSPSVTATDSYDYSAPGGTPPPERYVFSPGPIAGPASLSPGQTVAVTLTVESAGGAPQAGATAYLSFSPTSGGGSVTAPATSPPPAGTAGPGPGCGPGGALGANPTACVTDPDGQVQLTYTAGGSGSTAPTTGRDVITAQDAASSPTVTATDGYDYGAPTYTWTPDPVAVPGGLGSSQTVTLTLQALDGSGRPLAGAPVYLSMSGPGVMAGAVGAATATGAVTSGDNPTASPALRTNPVPFQADVDGRILVNYSTPAQPPAAATDTLVATSGPGGPNGPVASASDSYTYAPPTLVFSPNPVAPAGSLTGGQTVKVSLSVLGDGTATASGPPQPGATVYLSFVPGAGGGSAAVAGRALTAQPTAFTTDASGQVGVTYTAPASPPKTGTDTITAQDAASAPVHTAAARYSFATQGPAPGSGRGYWLVAGDGGIFSFGSAAFYGSTGALRLNRPVVGMTPTPDGHGYWFVASDGGVFCFGDARFYGSTGALHLAQPIVAMAATPDGRGYWLAARDGGIFTFGDARYYGSGAMYGSKLVFPVVGMAATADGAGYWEVASNGSVLVFGDAMYRGDVGGRKLNAPVVGMAATATGFGYWLVGSDGGIFAFGDAAYFGSTGAIRLNRPIIGMASTPEGAGYWLVASDGGVFAFGDAGFHGSEGGTRLNRPVVGMAGS